MCIRDRHGTVDKARLTEPAASHAAAQHLNHGAVMHRANHRNGKMSRQRLMTEVGQNRLFDHPRRPFVGGDMFDRAVRVIACLLYTSLSQKQRHQLQSIIFECAGRAVPQLHAVKTVLQLGQMRGFSGKSVRTIGLLGSLKQK